jgi:DNA polymerase III epsilon subunit-like protein
MKVLVFDTETTGLIPKKETQVWPIVVQLSYVFFDTNNPGNMVIENDIVNVGNIEIPIDSIRIHGITNEISYERGKPIKDVILKFSEYIEQSDILVAHNLQFDKRIIMKEYERLEYPNYFNLYNKVYYDTMHNGKELCQIYIAGRYKRPYLKFPKLTELYSKLFGEDELAMSNAHNAIIDVIMTMRCYLKMNTIKHTINFENLYKQFL